MNGTTTALALEASRAGRYSSFIFFLIGLEGRPCLLVLFAERGPDHIDR